MTGPGRAISRGSGLIADEDASVLTNAHVVEGAERVRVRVGTEHKPFEAKVVEADRSTDRAVLQLDDVPATLTPLPLGDSGKLAVGEPVVAIANPFASGPA